MLFGILALQMDFIKRDALIAAMNAWVLDKARPLGQILTEQGALAPDAHALLEALVQKHLHMHCGNAEVSLAALSSVGSARKDLERIADPDVQASLVQVAAARSVDADIYGTRAASVGAATSAGSRFRILRPHARGGLGEVFVAEDGELHREVALKQIQDRQADNADSRARFLLEAEITGGLEHPGIVPVYGLGSYADGRPFYAMRFIRGDSLKEAIASFHQPGGSDAGEHSLRFRKLLGRFVDVCNAIAYAHSRGVLHRDLKPGNIMLGKFGETLVVDWGLAKSVQASHESKSTEEVPLRPSSVSGTAETVAGSAVGTPAYMSPEQAAGRLDLLGPASDVYSLGATLYCLLTGSPPFKEESLGEILRLVQKGEFPRPRQVKRDVPAALEAVCLRAMALKPEDRYPSPRFLADDVEHWLADEPVSALAERWTQRLARRARRHRVWVRAAAVALLVVTGVSLLAAFWVNGERRRAEQAKADETDARQRAELAHEAETQQRRVADDALRAAQTALYSNHITQAERAWSDSNFDLACEALDACPVQQRAWEWNYMRRRCDPCLLTLAPSPDETALAVAFSPVGRRLASSNFRTIRIWDADSGKRSLEIVGEPYQAIYGLDFSPDGRRLAAGSWEPTVTVYDAFTGKMIWTKSGHTDKVYGVAFSRDGKRLVSASSDHTARLWDAATGNELHVLQGHQAWLMRAVFSPDGEHVATGSGDQTIKIWDVSKGEAVSTLRGHSNAVVDVAYSPDGKRLASASRDGTVRIWDPVTGNEVLTLKGHTREVTQVAFSPDGTRLASASHDRTLRVWEVATGQCLFVLRGHSNSVVGLAYSPDGQRLASCGFDRTTRVWDAASDPSCRDLTGHRLDVLGVAFRPDGQRVAAVGEEGVVRVWAPATGQPVLSFPAAQNHRVTAVAYSPDGRRLATTSSDRMVRLWDAATGKQLLSLSGHGDQVRCVAFSPDGRLLASGSTDKTLRVWTVETGQQVFACPGHTMSVESVAFSPDGRWLASGSNDKLAKIWDVADGRLVRTLTGHSSGLAAVTFNRDGSQLATGAWDHAVKLWDTASGELLATLEQGPKGLVNALAFSPDGTRLAVAADDQTVKVWEVKTGQLVLTARTAAPGTQALAYSPDGAWLATGGKDGVVRLLNGALYNPRHAP